MLAVLLGSLRNLAVPPDLDVRTVVVDNDPDGSAALVCSRFPRAAGPLHYCREDRPGIPAARNRALDEAAELGVRLLCFLDDDEVPETDWLVRIVEAWRRSGAHLVGGPVRPAPVAAGTGLWKRTVHAGLVARAAGRESRQATRAAAGADVVTATSNWLCDVPFMAAAGIRFDEAFRESGGEDTAFHYAARAAGARTAWAAAAVVNEVVPGARLTLRYQFRRARSQSMHHFRQHHPQASPAARAKAVAAGLLRIAAGALSILIPVRGGSSLVAGFQSVGWGCGRLQAVFGGRSRLYARPGGAAT